MPGLNDWIKKASSDLLASIKLSDDHIVFDCSIFHTHQSAEKAFKAFLVFVHQQIPKTHDLGVLLDNCAESDPAFLLLQYESKILNPYSSESRYPNDKFRIDQQKVEEAIRMAKKILDFVQKKVQQPEKTQGQRST
ncbi:HEPN domain-containing protein [Candidatus Babeliales bacterium]|nr:HEPN domain-containing protein [Candidatus Babeliales bacterium]